MALNKFAALFAPVQRGEYTLPAGLLAMREGITRLDAEPRPTLVSDMDEHALLVEQVIIAAVDGGPLPDTSAVQAARAATIEAADRHSVLVGATLALTSRLSGEIAAMGDEIILDHLAPAHAKLIAELVETLAITAEFGDDPASALVAPARVRNAFAALPGMYSHLEVLAMARRVVETAGYRAVKDQKPEFMMCRNINDMWPKGLHTHGRKPWPDGNEGTAWLLRHGAEFWMPTVSAMDSRYDEVYGAAEARQRIDRHDLNSYRAMA